jgi:hypothetical protein
VAEANRAIEPDSLNEAARLLFDLAETIREQFQGVNDSLTTAAEQCKDLLPDASQELSNFDERWSGYEYKDMNENVTTLAEYLAVFAADAEAIEEYTAADFSQLADPEMFGTEMRAAEIDADSTSTAYDGPR